MASLFRLKTIVAAADQPEHHRMARTLSWPHLVALGVGAIVGTGILTLIGVGADRAGPAVLISFVVAGAICACAALCYAEMATMIPASGSAYTYSYAALGEVIAWVVGWSLILEYSLVVSAVAVGWSGYAVGFLNGLASQYHLPLALPCVLTHGPVSSGKICDHVVTATEYGVNLPAVFIIAVVAGLLLLGTRESARVNTALVVLKVITLGLFVAVALPHFDAANFHPFAPHGYGTEVGAGGVKYGVMGAAAIIFFAFYGFDAISTAAEEAKNPERDLAIGIVGSMVACTIIYMVVAAVAVGALGFEKFSYSTEPLALILREIGRPGVATIVASAAVIALPTVILAFLYGQSRIFLVMARDGFLPVGLAQISKRGTPARITVVTAVVVSILAALTPLDVIASLANAGTLCAFIAVAACVLVLRRRDPAARRPFRTPAAWVIAPLAIAGCLYLFTSLQELTQVSFFIWNAIGLLIYFLYARRRAVISQS
jgi:APA family basic amino acid/polyamine antiporter